MSSNILESVNNYYTEKIKEFGNTPRGVDWNSVESQEIRFQQLCSVVPADGQPSVLDFGCGYGAMLGYLESKCPGLHYTGLDISEEMIRSASQASQGKTNCTWKTKLEDNDLFDYTIASGIFNVRLGANDAEWKQYILDTLNTINKHSSKGFSFNMLTSYSDKEYMKDYLYYADPMFFFDYCKRNFSKWVAVLHDYPLYEFTIIVKK